MLVQGESEQSYSLQSPFEFQHQFLRSQSTANESAMSRSARTPIRSAATVRKIMSESIQLNERKRIRMRMRRRPQVATSGRYACAVRSSRGNLHMGGRLAARSPKKGS